MRLMIRIFRIFRVLIVVPSTVFIFGSGVLILSFFGVGRQIQMSLGRWWSQTVLYLLGVRIECVGLERIQGDTALVVTPNHASLLDVIALYATLPGPVHFVAKRELSRIPIFGPAARAAGAVFIDRATRKRDARSFDEIERAIQNKGHVVMFPEGTRSPDGRLQAFKGGPFLIAIDHRTAILPVAIENSHRLLPKGEIAVRSGTIRLTFMNSIPTDSYNKEDRASLRDRVCQTIGEIIADDPPVVEFPR